MEVMYNLKKYIWFDRFWLPPNVTWDDVANNESDIVRYPSVNDIYLSFLVAIIIIIVRPLFERYIGSPIAAYYHLSDTSPKRVEPNAVLESAFVGKVDLKDSKVVEDLCRKSGFTAFQVRCWFKRRRFHGKSTPVKKFNETLWRFVGYFSLFYGGLYVMVSKTWFWDLPDCWRNYPQKAESSLRTYYMVQLGVYWSLLFSAFSDVRRKDFWEMIVHHFASIILISFSWVGMMFRVGSLVVLLHDCVDYWLEAAKLTKYMGYQTLCNVLFAIFTLLWITTRLGIYPYWVMWIACNPTGEVGHFHCMMVYLLWILLVLHFIWTFMILKVVYQAFSHGGQVQKDDRSDSEDSDMEEDTTREDSKDK